MRRDLIRVQRESEGGISQALLHPRCHHDGASRYGMLLEATVRYRCV